MKTQRFENKAIVIAGGAGGIGTAASLLLASYGATAIVIGRKNSHMAVLRERLKLIQPKSICLEADLRSYDAWSSALRYVNDEFHRIDVLVNCVGTITPGSLDELTIDQITSAVETNLLSAVYGMRAALPIMKSQRRGHIITLGSLGGIVPMPFESLYCATKFAVRGFCLSMSQELNNTGIDVSLISPGPVRTKMLDLEASDDRWSMSFVQHPLDPEQVAEAIVQLIEKPQRELILPRTTGKLSLLVNLFPDLFRLVYPVLDFVGKIKLKKYRETRLNLEPFVFRET